MSDLGFMRLLTTSGNPKTDKGAKYGFATAILHLAPADLSGWNTCPGATAGCKAACLNTAGHGGIAKGGIVTYDSVKSGARSNAVQAARIARTAYLFQDRQAFLQRLHKEIAAFIRKVEKAGLVPCVRLNGTSDIRWEASAFHLDGKSIFDHFPNVRFYDYTKLANRRDLPANYSVTFSLADGNEAKARAALANGLNVAAVFRSEGARDAWRKIGFLGHPVIDGDDSDLRFLDPKGVIVGLYAKGNARHDTTGFVVDHPVALQLAA
jgi:hypothetical protein